MASSGKPKTTMAKLKREATLRERRAEKATRKRIRKLGQLDPSPEDDIYGEMPDLDSDVLVPEAPEHASDLSAPESTLGVRL